MTSGTRDLILTRFRYLEPGERGLLSNARCLGEGVDVPSIDGVSFIDPRRSQIDVMQAVGRAIRRSEEKKVGTVVLPVFIRDQDDPEALLKRSVFQPVWAVLQALRAHDEVLAEELDSLRRALGRWSPKRLRLPGKIHLDLPISVDKSFARAFEVRLVEQSTANWEFWFGLLCKYVDKTGHARVPFDYRDDDYWLGAWVNSQRMFQKKSQLSSERRSRLEALPGWLWTPMESDWDKSFARLEDFVRRHGHAKVPRGLVESGFSLGGWVSQQRAHYRVGRLRSDRIARLEGLPGWSWYPYDSAWEKSFLHLQRFAEREGHARVPKGHVEEGLNLATWVSWQRRGYTRGELSKDRASRLEALPGWTWSFYDSEWEESFTHLQRFAHRTGHAKPLWNEVEGGFKVGAWVVKQREYYRRSKLSSDRVARLEALPGWKWGVFDAAWEGAFEKLERFVDREKHARVPQRHIEEGFRLGSWVTSQRSRYRRGELSSDRVSRLEAIPGWSWGRSIDP
jgi:hypothetical protein